MARLIRTHGKRIEHRISIAGAPPPGQVYFGSSRRDALKELWFGLSSGEIGLLTGEVGLGKTLLCRELLRRLPTAVHSVYTVTPKQDELLIDNVLQSVSMIRQLHRSVVTVAETSEREAIDTFAHWAIIVDEAQRLSVATIRRLAEWRHQEAMHGRSVGLLLVGQPSVEETLSATELRSFALQITARCQLPAFPRSETEAYINHWLQQQWPGARVVFSETANRVVHYASGGIPREINKVCLRAIDSLRLQQKSSVNALMAVRAAWRASTERDDDSNDDDTYPGMIVRRDDDEDAYPKTVRISDLKFSQLN